MRPRGALSFSEPRELIVSAPQPSAWLYPRVSSRVESPGQTVRSRHVRHPALTRSDLTGEVPGGRDELPPQQGRDPKHAVLELQQAPGAGDRDIGQHREQSCRPRPPVPAAARQDGDPARAQATRSRSPIPAIPRCGWHPPRPRTARAPGQLHLMLPEALAGGPRQDRSRGPSGHRGHRGHHADHPACPVTCLVAPLPS